MTEAWTTSPTSSLWYHHLCCSPTGQQEALAKAYSHVEKVHLPLTGLQGSGGQQRLAGEGPGTKARRKRLPWAGGGQWGGFTASRVPFSSVLPEGAQGWDE
nr:unnamed protein product [Rangifer tarandus platyrhynchus]